MFPEKGEEKRKNSESYLGVLDWRGDTDRPLQEQIFMYLEKDALSRFAATL